MTSFTTQGLTTQGLQIGLLGCDRRVVDLLAEAVARGGRVVFACDVAERNVRMLVDRGLCPPDVPVSGSWEPLVDATQCDCVLVAADGWTDARGEGVRKLVQAGRRLVVSHPSTLSMLWAYEIDMIRADSGATVVPDLADRLHPFVARLRGLVEAGLAGASPLGNVDAIVMERRPEAFDRESVLRAFCRDADLLRAVAGDAKRLSTLGATPHASSLATLAVELSGPANVPVRWQAVRGEVPKARLSLLCERGSATIEIPDDPCGAWLAREAGIDGTVTDERSLAFDRPAAVLDLLSGPHAAGSPADAPEAIPPATWPDAARTIEYAETVPRSIAKGRAIDLHQEEFSEIGTFKGTMASLGCGIVLAGLLLLMLATLVGGIAREAGWEAGERVAGAWPWIVLAVLVAFRALQVIPLLIREPGRGHR
jgi:myo-inositol 2-dehydrogenase/D-chiro-inositol 1-dehydrogenase